MSNYWRQPTRSVVPGTEGSAFTRLKGKERHVTIYPLTRTAIIHQRERIPLEKDSTLPEVEVVMKSHHWWPTGTWTELEPGVFVARIIKGAGEEEGSK